MKIFLSYAREDAEVARVVYDRLCARNHTVFNWQAPENDGKRFIEATEEAIRNANYFLALMSPSYLASNWCREERNFAIRCEHERAGGATQFMQVLQVSQVSYRDAGYIGNYAWRDMTSPDSVASVLEALIEDMNQEAKPSPEPPSVETADNQGTLSRELVFRNREDELEKVLRGLANAAGPHFWLVIGPPRLGKTWFLERVCKDLPDSPEWVINRIDLREEPPEVREDAGRLLSRMFRRSMAAVDLESLRAIAIEISKSRQPHLCVLDSAELLDAATVASLRDHLQPIYQRVRQAGVSSSRLALIVASRQDEGWRGLRPDPRLASLPLTEFTVDVVQTALRGLGADRTIGEESYWDYATLAHNLTEGLPALLSLCLRWVVDQGWTDLDRMADAEIFRNVAGQYIESDLLTSASFFPGDTRQGNDELLALRSAYRLLAPYRLFTQSHLQHHLEQDPDLTDILGRLNWSAADLWEAITRTALLSRPTTEAWQRIHPAVRRLLYRYFYESGGLAEDAALAGVEAHGEAGRFIKYWSENQDGTEQVVGLVESLWHDANVLLTSSPGEAASELIASARKLSEDLRPSRAYTLLELRAYAEKLMRGDEEFQRAFSPIDGLFERLVAVVLRP
jgi:TIR domain-containing protein